MKLSRRELLASTAAASLLHPAALAAGGPNRPKRLIVVLVDGGWDVTHCFDPKFHSNHVDTGVVDEDPGNPDDREYVDTFGEMTLALNDFKRPNVTAFFQHHYQQCCIVNGIWMGALAHIPAHVRQLTGTTHNTDPAYATIVGAELGGDVPLGSLDMSGKSFQGHLAASSGQIGHQGQIKTLLDPKFTYNEPPGANFTFPQFVPDSVENAQLDAFINRRTERMLAAHGDGAHNDRRLNDLTEALRRSGELRDEGGVIVDFLPAREKPSLEVQSRLAVALLRQDICRAVTLDSGDPWDTHSTNVLQHGYWNNLFGGLRVLMARLKATDLIDDTLVVVTSEFARTPTINVMAGKDHWPHGARLMFGAGVHKERTFGATDDRLESLAVDYETGLPDPKGLLNKYTNFNAGLLEAFGIDPAKWYPDADVYRGCFV